MNKNIAPPGGAIGAIVKTTTRKHEKKHLNV
jgi:hypothetical protein